MSDGSTLTPAYDILKRAFAMYLDRDNYAYFYGAKGQVLTDAVMDALIAAEPEYFSKYNEAEMKRIRKFSKGKIGLDCSGFVGKCVGCMEWSGALWGHCYNKSTVLGCKAGSILYRPGHVGLDIGYGYAMDMPIEGLTITIHKNNAETPNVGGGDRKYIGGGEYRGYDYSMMTNF